MSNKELNELTDKIVALYEKGFDIMAIAKQCNVPASLVASILVQTKGIFFR